MMMANFKQKMKKCFFKYQYSSVRSYVETFIPQELDADAKKKRAKNMSKHVCHLINTLVFSTTYAADVLASQRVDCNGQLPHTSESWAAILRVPEFVPISRRKEERHEEEANTDDSNDDNDSDDDDDNNNIRERAETEHMVPTEPVQNRNPQARQRRITLGQRWCQTYIPEDQLKWYIISHRRALGVLLTASSNQDRRQRHLKPKLLKKANYLLKSKLRYLEFLRFKNSQHNSKRFQLFPEYKMGTKYFRIDAKILGQLRNATLTVDWETGKPFMQAARRRRSTINRALVGTNTNVDLWAEIFDLSGIQRDEQTKISMTTDGIGVSVTFGEEQDAEEEDDDDEEEEEQEDDDDMEEDRDEELIDITQYDHGMFKLQKLHPLRLAETLRTAGLIGVDPGLKSIITAVRSEDPNDKLEVSSGNMP
jgi:hypothetical protein